MSLLEGHSCLTGIKLKTMKQFLMLIRTEGDHLEELSTDEQKDHVQKVKGYIGKLITRRQAEVRPAIGDGRDDYYFAKRQIKRWSIQ